MIVHSNKTLYISNKLPVISAEAACGKQIMSNQLCHISFDIFTTGA